MAKRNLACVSLVPNCPRLAPMLALKVVDEATGIGHAERRHTGLSRDRAVVTARMHFIMQVVIHVDMYNAIHAVMHVG